MDVTVREARPGDGPALARLHHENAAYYAALAPGDFKLPDEDGLIEFIESDLAAPPEGQLALVAEIGGELAGYLEARLLRPLETARFQTSSALAEPRLF